VIDLFSPVTLPFADVSEPVPPALPDCGNAGGADGERRGIADGHRSFRFDAFLQLQHGDV